MEFFFCKAGADWGKAKAVETGSRWVSVLGSMDAREEDRLIVFGNR